MSSPAEALAKEYGLLQPQRITEGITNRQLARVLKEASQEAEKLIQFNIARGNLSGFTRAAQLKQATAGLGPISTELWTQTGKITRAGMYEAAQLAADQAIDQDFFLGMPGNGIIQYAHQIHFEASASVESLISRRTNGFTLADRIYANGRIGVKKAALEVEKGLALQQSAKEIAGRVKGLFNPDVPGGTSYAAKRLARTEISNAHHETTIRMSKDKPWVIGFRWQLSSSHPRPDVCDALARHEEGLGRGVYGPKNAPSKPHPQCLCYLTHVVPDSDEFVNGLAKGDYDNWLSGKGVTC